MLSSSQRLSVEQFNEVMKKGRIINSPFFTLRAMEYTENTRVSTVTPKKIAKKAVDRNRMRRKMYPVIRSIYKELKNGFYILTAKSPSLLLKSDELKKEIAAVFVKGGLMK